MTRDRARLALRFAGDVLAQAFGLVLALFAAIAWTLILWALMAPKA